MSEKKEPSTGIRMLKPDEIDAVAGATFGVLVSATDTSVNTNAVIQVNVK
jgi:hypothetical protein